MTDEPRRDHRKNSGLKIFQANVGHNDAYHGNALSLAWEDGFDIILIQEPWTKWDAATARRLTINHPGFQAFNPLNDWKDTRPSVLTYTRISANLPSKQLAPPGLENGCVCWVSVCGYTIVNVYRRAAEDITTDILRRWGKPPAKTIIAGDFNAKHWLWQPGVQTDTPGREISEWAEATEVEPTLVGSPTRHSGYTIDLVFTNCPASSHVEKQLNTGSDHYTVVTKLPEPERGTPGAGRRYVPIDAMEEFGKVIKEHCWTLPNIDTENPTHESLDKAASSLQELFADTIAATGKKRHHSGHSAPWWDEECRNAHKNFLAAPEGSAEQTDARKALRNTVKNKKRAHWDKIIAEAGPKRGIFKLAKWRKATDRFQPPPLLDGTRSISDPTERATFLRDHLLNRKGSEDDISDPWTSQAHPTARIPWNDKISSSEAKKATTGAGNTAPGADGVSVSLLKEAWPSIGDFITDLFHGCLVIGYHPTPFRKAEVTIIPKPGKEDYTTYKAFRPISLLSCIGKGLERLIARRISLLALEHKVLPRQYFGALPKEQPPILSHASYMTSRQL